MSLNTYLYFDGDCAAAFDFYRSVFGGEYAANMTFADGPPDLGFADTEADKIMHVSLPIGGSVLMGSDVAEGFGDTPVPGGFAISYTPASRDEADSIFARLTEGGAVTMEMQETFWGAYFGQGTDKFGIQWMINLQLDQG